MMKICQTTVYRQLVYNKRDLPQYNRMKRVDNMEKSTSP